MSCPNKGGCVFFEGDTHCRRCGRALNGAPPTAPTPTTEALIQAAVTRVDDHHEYRFRHGECGGLYLGALTDILRDFARDIEAATRAEMMIKIHPRPCNCARCEREREEAIEERSRREEEATLKIVLALPDLTKSVAEIVAAQERSREAPPPEMAE